jgi:hypothetical protein
MKTEVRVTRGPLRGRSGWIAGSLEDRAPRGITRAIVHAGAEVELLEIANLRREDQLGLFPHEPDEPHRQAHGDRYGHHRAGRDRCGAAAQIKTPPA